jgi:hypothetical protein
MEVYEALVAATPYDDSRRAWSKADRRLASFARQAPDHRGGYLPALKDFYYLERHRAKTLGGLLARLAAKVAAYTCAQRLPRSTAPPPGRPADLAHCASVV